MATGTVKWFNADRGYGFIRPEGGGGEVFVHRSVVTKAGLRDLLDGETVSYDEIANRGKVAAANLKLISSARLNNREFFKMILK